ncbi:UNVERIFIED_CONTAM: hypothetical protein GTU68_037814 [Idotea baltica]|nr:hypothetical protein [Idotea baltica]
MHSSKPKRPGRLAICSPNTARSTFEISNPKRCGGR